MIFMVTPLILLIHIAEEWRDFPAWATRHFGATSRAWYVDTHIVLMAGVVAICWLATATPGRTMTILAIAVQWGLFINAVFHAVTWLAFKEYSPGTYSALILFVRATVWQLSTTTLDAMGFA